MALHKGIEAPFEYGNVQRLLHSQCHIDVVGHALWLQLLQKPESFLCQRNGTDLPILFLHKFSPHETMRRGWSCLQASNGLRQLRNGGTFKEALQRHCYLEERLEACNNLHRQQRMAAQNEKVVMDTNLFNP